VESNVFGTAIAGSCPSGPAEGLNGNVVFQDVAGQVSRLEWNTLLIELTSFEFNYVAVILGSSETSDRWRAEITNSNVSPFSGARIQELDGFGQLASANGVPEPATMFVAGAGLLLLVLQRKGRKA